MKYFIVLALTFSGFAGFCHSTEEAAVSPKKVTKTTKAKVAKKVKKDSRSPASSDGQEQQVVIGDPAIVGYTLPPREPRERSPFAREVTEQEFRRLNPNEFAPSCDYGERIFSDGTCRPAVVVESARDGEWVEWVDTRRSDYCYRVREVAGRTYDSNRLVEEAQRAFNRWEDTLWANVERARASRPEARRFSACNDCGVCNEGSGDNGGGFSFSVSRNVAKPRDLSREPMPGIDDPEDFRRRNEGRPSLLPPMERVPGGRIRFRF